MTKKQNNSVLDQHNIKKLTQWQHSRARCEMYLSSRSVVNSSTVLFNGNGYELQELNYVPSLLVAFREIFDNSIDAGIKNKIKDLTVRVDYNPEELSFIIQDNSGGMPIDYSPSDGKNIAELLVSNTMMGSNFNDDERVGAGVNGLGGSIVCNVSKSFSLEIIRAGQPFKELSDYTGNYKYVQTFSEGSEFFPELQIGVPKITPIKSDKCGTTVKFQLSKDVFKNHELPSELIVSIINEVAACNTDYKFYFNGTRISYNGTIEKNLFGKKKPISLEIKDASISLNSTFYVIPGSFDSETLISSGLVNNIPSIGGKGTHIDAFKKGFALGIISALEKESKKRKLKPNRSDIENGLFIYNNTKMNAPFFNSQVKTELINEEVIKPINTAMSTEWFSDVVKKNKDWVEEIYVRCAERTNKKDADEDRKAAKKLVKGKVAKLRPATGTEREKCTLLLAEGDCLEENTEILVFEDGHMCNKAIKDIQNGDLVLTHENKIKPVLNVSHKVKETITFSTPQGDIIMSPEHRMLVLRNNEFVFIEAQFIDCNDQFVKTQLVDNSEFMEIESITEVDGSYILVLQGEHNRMEVNSSAVHVFCVYDSDNEVFMQIPCSELDKNIHSIAVK